ncbi:MAG: hypothetical protein IPH36_10530 [Saprospiraceae bacterium]|nr:hypothetical protein [Saprospiraceae bacterium]
MTYANGDVYKGSWNNDYPSGEGEYFFADGSSYAGQFINGNFDGRGRFREIDGSSYDGEWKDNVLMSKIRKTEPVFASGSHASGA